MKALLCLLCLPAFFLTGCATAQANARARTPPGPVKRLHKIYWSGRGDWEASRPTWTYPLEQNGKVIQPTSP